jgi:hypothetical protein
MVSGIQTSRSKVTASRGTRIVLCRYVDGLVYRSGPSGLAGMVTGRFPHRVLRITGVGRRSWASPARRPLEPVRDSARRDRGSADLGGYRACPTLSWSPDARWLAFSGGLEGLGGTWLFDTSNNRPIAISGSQANALAWSPAGDQIAAITPIEQEGVSVDSKIAIFNLRDLV